MPTNYDKLRTQIDILILGQRAGCTADSYKVSPLGSTPRLPTSTGGNEEWTRKRG